VQVLLKNATATDSPGSTHAVGQTRSWVADGVGVGVGVPGGGGGKSAQPGASSTRTLLTSPKFDAWKCRSLAAWVLVLGKVANGKGWLNDWQGFADGRRVPERVQWKHCSCGGVEHPIKPPGGQLRETVTVSKGSTHAVGQTRSSCVLGPEGVLPNWAGAGQPGEFARLTAS
jgi:hypothetical protein